MLQCSLESVLATSLLDQRIPRVADPAFEAEITSDLIRKQSKAPLEFFSILTEAILYLTHAGSAGVSLLDKKQGRFVWPAVSGGLSPHLGSGTPADFGPCGVVLEHNSSVLFLHPERYFTYLQPITPPLEEVLLHPFHLNGEAVGTLWAVIDEKGKHFDSEDRRILANLSNLAAHTYRVLVEAGQLQPILDDPPQLRKIRPMAHEDGKWRFADKEN
ncbi:MAG: GAF domain-containing protein [Verrucomicrobiaceae bacterium]|nr:MAG: GAF domain-containing protein [Verrucomicrobiaceae bacterium]